MKKRILSFLMAFCMVVALLPVTVLAETATVSKIFITMTALEAGKSLPTDAKTGSAANTEVTKVEWSGETDNGNMISGKDYTATFTIEIKPDRDAAFSARSITATVNGSSDGVRVTRINNGEVKVTYYTNPSAAPNDDEAAPLPGTDDTVEHYRMDFDASMELPVAGVKPADSKVSVDESRYTLLKVEWSGELDASGCFKEGVAYTATVTERINEGFDGLFMKDSLLEFSTYSNGIVVKYDNKATLVSISGDGKEITVSYTFEPAPAHAATSVSEVEITTSVPAEGKPLPTDARVPDDAGFRVTKVEWTGRTDNGLAVAGVPNPVTFTLEIKPDQDAQFHASIRNIYINDEFMGSGWDERVSPTVLKVHYVFPAIGGLNLPGAHSGFTDLDKMSQAEISASLKNPANPPEVTGFDVFGAQPSYTEPYAPGELRANPLALMSNRLSLMRSLAGLEPVMTHYQLGDGAQAAAMLLASSGFSNDPPRPSGMSQSLYDMASKSIGDSTLYHVTSPDNQMVQAIDTLMEGTGRGITTTRGNSIRTLYSRMWLLWPYPLYVGFGYAKNGNDQYVTVDVTDYSLDPHYYDFISWPASGNFPNNLDAFTSSSPWSVYLNPEVYSMPQPTDITVTITRASDGKVWTIPGAGSYKTSDEKYFALNAQKHMCGNGLRLEYSSIVFRPDGIGKYEGEYAVRIDGLKLLGGKDTSLDYTVIFFDADHPNDPTPTETVSSFSDVLTTAWYAKPVAWAVEKGVTAGTSKTTFSPDATCTQAQILTFLWRAKDEPNPTGTVSGTQYYATAAQWAKEQGLTDNFSAEADCTRSMVVAYLWKLAGSPKTGTSNFSDVSANADYAQAVAWAVEQGITSGTSATTFSPNATCTRGQIVTFLYRAFAK